MPRFARSAMLTAGCLAFAVGLTALGSGAAVAAGGGLAPPAVDPATVHAPTAVPDRIVLSPTATPATSQAVTWRTSDVVTSPQVQWALSGPGPVDAAETVAAATSVDLDITLGYRSSHHSALIEGLSPDTAYLYRVGDGETWSEWLEFQTAADEVGGFSFLTFGDTQNDNKAYVSRALRAGFEARPYARLAVYAGDLIETDISDAEWGEWHEAAGFANQYLNVIATPGNHEYYPGPGLAQQWRAQFALPLNGPAGTAELAETVYYTDYQGVRMISLDSMHATTDGSLAAQTAWLEEVLSENPNPWTVVTFHHPIFSATANRDNAALRDAWLPLLEEHGVDLVLQGHDHAYARGNLLSGEENLPQGADPATSHTGPVFLVSNAGPKMYDPDTSEETNWSANGARLRVGGGYVQLYQTVDVTDDGRMHVEARTIDGTVFDSFTIEKDDEGRGLVTDEEAWAGGPGSTRTGVAAPGGPVTPTPEPTPTSAPTSTPTPAPTSGSVPADDRPALIASRTVVAPGESLEIAGTGFVAGEDVVVELRSTPVTLTRAVTAADGSFTATVTIPHDTVLGHHTLVARGLTSGDSAVADLMVASAGGGATALPATGGEISLALLAAGGVLAVGGGLLVARTVIRPRKAS